MPRVIPNTRNNTMGNWISNALADLLALNKEARLLMLGLDSAGKTSILFQMKLGESVSAPPTIGFNVERVSVENLTFTIWDVCIILTLWS